MLNKLGGIYATRAGAGPHKRKESIPLTILLRNRLHYAFTRQEAIKIVRDKEGLIKVDNKIRRDPRFPLGIMDVISIAKTNENFRILFDTKGRYQAHKIDSKEASFKLCSVKRKAMGENSIPYIVTHDGRTIRYPHPDIKRQDTIKLNLESGEVESLIKYENGAQVLIIGGNNIGRVGVLQHIERHPSSFDIAHVKDANGEHFATRSSNVFVIGEGKKPVITLLPSRGIKLGLIEERDLRLKKSEEQ